MLTSLDNARHLMQTHFRPGSRQPLPAFVHCQVLALALLLGGLIPVDLRAELMEGLPVAKLEREKPVDFATEIYPFLRENCLACHNRRKAKSGLVLESPQDMLKGGDIGPAIEPGDAEWSLLFTTAAHQEEPTMPPKNNKSKAENLSPEQLALLKRWIDEGAKGGAVSAPAPESWTFLKGPQPVGALALSRNGRFAVAGRGQQLDIYDLRLGRLEVSLRDPGLDFPAAHRDVVQSLDFGSEGTLASGGYRMVKLWRRSEGRLAGRAELPAESTAAALSPDGSTAAWGTKDGSLVLLPVENGELGKGEALSQKVHQGAVTGLAFGVDGRWIYSLAEDKTVARHSADALGEAAGKQDAKVLTLPAIPRAVEAVAKGRLLALGGDDGLLLLTSAELTAPVTPAEKKAKPSPSPAPKAKEDGATPQKQNAPKPKPQPEAKAASKAKAKPAPETKAKPAARTQSEPKPKSLPAAKTKPKAKLQPQPKPKPYLQFRFNKTPLVALAAANAEGTELLVGHRDGTVIHLRLDPAHPAKVPEQVRRFHHGSALDRLALSPAGVGSARLATSGPNGVVKLWDLASGKPVADLAQAPHLEARLGETQRAIEVATRQESYWKAKAPEAEALGKAESERARNAGETIAAANRELAAKRRALARLSPDDAKRPDAALAVEEAARALAGQRRARDAAARLAGEAFAEQLAAESRTREAAALAKKLREEEKSLAEEAKAAPAAPAALAFSRDGAQLLAALPGEGGLRLWSAATGAWLEDLGEAKSAASLLVTGEKQLLLASTKRVESWTLPGQWSLARTLGDGEDPEAFPDRVFALDFSPDASLLAAGTGVASRSGLVSLWDVASGEKLAENDESHEDAVTAVAFSPDGERVASAGADQFVKVFDRVGLEESGSFEGHGDHVLGLAWNPDQLALASAGADGEVRVWDLVEGEQQSTDDRFEGEVGAVAYLGGSDKLLTATSEGDLKIAGQPVSEAAKGGYLHAAGLSADGTTAAAGGEDGVLRVWNATDRKLLHQFAPPRAGKERVAAE